MSFKLIVEIDENLKVDVNFEGEPVNHVILAGVLETIKHSMLNTAQLMSLQQDMEVENATSTVKSGQETD